jgi:hypothetical protein
MLVAWELWKERKGKGDIALFCCYYWVDGTTPKNLAPLTICQSKEENITLQMQNNKWISHISQIN